MDELTYEALLANGYTYNHGGIIDAEGNYLSSVELNGETINSPNSFEDYSKINEASKSKARPQEILDRLESFEKAPLTTSLSEQDEAYYPTFMENKKAKGEDTYEDIRDFIEVNEKKAFESGEDLHLRTLRQLQRGGYESLISEDHINEVKNNNSLLQKYKDTDKDYVTHLQDAIENPSAKEDSFLGGIINSFWGFAYSMAQNTLSHGTGMEGSEEEKKEYSEAKKREKELKEPAAEIMAAVTDENIRKVEEVRKNLSNSESWEFENRLTEYALGELKVEKDRIAAFREGSNIYNPFNKDFMGDLFTLGIGDAYDQYNYNAYLHNKINKGEELTEKEQIVAETLANIDMIQGLNLEQTGLYGLMEGTAESAKFMAGGFAGRVLLRGTTAAVTRGVAKSLHGAGAGAKTSNILGTVAGESVNMLGQAVLHPATHVEALNKYNGSIYFDLDDNGEVEVTTERRTYNTLMREAEIQENQLEDLLATTQDVDQARQIQAKLEDLKKYKSSIKAPTSAFDAIAYGFTETLKENLAENYGGALAKGIFVNKYTRRALENPWVKKATGSGIGKTVGKANDLFKNSKASMNNFIEGLTGYTGTTKLIGNNFEEILEEVMVQAMPVWGETEEEAIMRRGELLEGSFYAQVAGQTLLMGAAMKPVSLAMKAPGAIKNWEELWANRQDIKSRRKDFNNMLKEFKKAGVSESKVEEMLMATGKGNFSVQQYNNTIEELKKENTPESLERAHQIEKNKNYNIGKSLIQMGRGKKFVRQMESLILSKNLPKNSIPSIVEAMNEVKTLEAEMREFDGLRNRDYILELKSSLRYNENQKKDLQKRKEQIQNDETIDRTVAEGLIDGIDEQITSLELNSEGFNKDIKYETSPKRVKELKEEADMTSFMLKSFNKKYKESTDVRDALRKYEDSSETEGSQVDVQETREATEKALNEFREEALEEAKKRFGITVGKTATKNSKKAFDKATKNLDNQILLQILSEKVKEYEEYLANNPETEVENDVVEFESEDHKNVNDHIDEVSVDVWEVTKVLGDSLEEREESNIDEPPLDVPIPSDNTAPPFEIPQDPFDSAGKIDIEEDDADWDDMPTQQLAENEHFKRLVESVKKRYEQMKERDGVAPTFENYVYDLLTTGEMDSLVVQSHLIALAAAWNFSGLGAANWRKIQTDLMSSAKVLNEMAENKTKNVLIEQTPAQVEEQEKNEEEVVNNNSLKPAVGVDPHSGAPIHVTPNSGKTFGTEQFIHYSAVEYEHRIETKDGKKVYVKVTTGKPKLRKPTWFNFKHLVNPNKNNIGDKLSPKVLADDQLASTLVPVRDSYGKQGVPMTFEMWKVIHKPENASREEFNKSEFKNSSVETITFENWVELNIPEGTSFEDFKKSDAYISKVPMAYIDSNGDAVAPVTEVEWFSPTSVGDRSKEDGDIDLDNISPSHQKDIDENREKALTLRKQIIDGTVTEVEIMDNLSNPPLQKLAKLDSEGNLQLAPTLNKVAPESQLVWMKSTGQLYDLDGKIIKTADILNYGDHEKGFAEREIVTLTSKGKTTKHRLPKNMNQLHYLVHTSTVDGVKKYIALKAFRKDEQGNDKANEQDVQTARWIAAINNVTRFYDDKSGSSVEKNKKHALHMSKDQAEDLREQIKAITEIDVKYEYSTIIEALISYNQDETIDKENKKVAAHKVFSGSAIASSLISVNKETGVLVNDFDKYDQNTYFPKKQSGGIRNKPMISIRKDENGKFIVEKVKITEKTVDGKKVDTAETYDDFLKERLSTDVIGFNVGTEQDPVYTHAVQQTVIFKPVINSKISPKEEVKNEIEKETETPEVKKKVEETTVKDSKTIEKKRAEERDKAMTKAAALAKMLNLDIRDINETDDMIAQEMSTTENVDESITSVAGLTTKQEEEVIAWVFAKMADKNSSVQEAKDAIVKDLTLKIEELNESISSLYPFIDNPVVAEMLETLVKAKVQNEDILANIGAIINETSQRAMNVSFINEDDASEGDEQEDKNFSKSSNQTKHIDKVGTALKRIFAQVTDGKKGFMGLDTYTSFKQMYDTVSLALSTDTELKPGFNEMMDLLDKREDSAPWMKELIKKLRESDEQVQKQFVYNLYKQKINAKFAMLSRDKDKKVDSQIYDSNANEAKRATIDRWRENFKRSPLNNEGKINTAELQSAINEWGDWFDKGEANQPLEVYQKWLGRFGITLSDNTWRALQRGELNVSEGGGRLRTASFAELFDNVTSDDKKTRPGLLFSNLRKYATNNVDKKEESLEFYENLKNHPYEDMGTILNQLAELENKYNPTYNSTSRYINGKSVSEVESFTYFYEQFKKLKSSSLSKDKKYLKELMSTSFAQDSFIMKLMLEDDVFAQQFDHGMVDLMALKEAYKKSPMFSGIDELSNLDYMFVQRTLFQNRKQGSEKQIDGQVFKVRTAHMSTLTNSDKGRMMLIKTAVFDFFKQADEAFIRDENGGITFTEDLKQVVYDNLVTPELRRMINFITNVKETNIKDYDKGAVRFNLMPELNTILNTAGETVQEVIERVENEVKADESVSSKDKNKVTQEKALEVIQTEFKDGFTNHIQDNVLEEASDNVRQLAQFNNKKVDSFNNANYLESQKGTTEQKMELAEIDYILNSMFSNMNYMQMMPGDPALYYKGKGDPKSKDVKEQTSLSQSLAINLGKRMAAMIAPGSVLANSHKNFYQQIFLEDVNGIAENILYIAGLHYDKAILKEEHTNGLTFEEMFIKSVEGDLQYTEILQDKFPAIAEFIDIESTDAQELTTTKEHLYILRQQGRIPKKILDKIEKKLKKQKQFFANKDNIGKPLPKKYKLDTVIQDSNTDFEGQTELELIMQPIKPVYSGTILDTEQDVNRMMYIKSSSFPLIPELTVGRQLDDLRKNMEKIEEEQNTTVRASYQSANKVGGLTKENTLKSFSDPILPNNMLTLNREHFKIQQDVPFKSSKVQDDTVSMGTQIFKLLMGDGILDLEGFEFEGEIMNGKELQSKFQDIFSEMIGIKKDKFLSSLGINSDGTVENKEAAIEKLRRLLVREAKSRGFSKQDLKILSLVDGKNGEKIFKLPLWLTGNSNKYESMLNAMINNKIFKQKLPGNKFVAGSEAGFQVKEGLENLSELSKSRIVHLGDYKGGTLKSTTAKDLSTKTADRKGFRESVAPKQGVQELFEENPELANIGTQEQYSEYLNTIFPDSKVKDIIYHGSKSKTPFNVAKTEQEKIWPDGSKSIKKGFYVTKNKKYAEAYSKEGHLVKAIVNVENPLESDKPIIQGNLPELNSNQDSIIGIELGATKAESIILFKPEQIHILGSKQDVEGFKTYQEASKQINDLNTVSKAQVLLPSKFKLGGKLIDLFQGFDGENGTYLEKVGGIIKIKEGMIDQKLLEQFVFRIPTSSHGLGSSIEVVGFLSPESGDLIVTPKGFVAQMGQDFDVDSLTAYQYHHLVMSDGRVKLLTQESKEEYIAEQKSKIEKIEKAVKEEDNQKLKELNDSVEGLENLQALNKDDMLAEIEAIKESIEKDFDLKLLENQFIKVHNSVYSNPASQKHINKVLSMSVAEKQADDIEALTSGKGNSFNILSPKYQMDKMNAGSTGQDAIAIYAKGVTMHSLTQQANAEGKEVRLGYMTEEGPKHKTLRIGNLSSDGIFGKTFSASSPNPIFKSLARRISIALDERTNTGTDNEKAQILGRTGLNNKESISVDNFLISQGIDMEFILIYSQEQYDSLSDNDKMDGIIYDEKAPFHDKAVIDGETVYFKKHSIPYLLHSQPIIREFFDLIAKKNSNVTEEFSDDVEAEVIRELIAKYKYPNMESPAFYRGEYGEWVDVAGETLFSPLQGEASRKFTGEFLERQISLGESSNNVDQLQILAQYVDLMSDAKKSKRMTQHVDMNNLGKSMWESATKVEEFRDFFTKGEQGILGVENLIGEFITEEEYNQEINEQVLLVDDETSETLENEVTIGDKPLDKKQYIYLGKGVYLKPTTNQGVMVGTALSLSESLFSDLFPAKNIYIQSIMKNIFTDSNIKMDNSFAVIKAKEHIFQEMKKFMTSAEMIGLFSKGAKETRNELMTDDVTKGQVSLSSYLNNLMTSDSSEYKEGLKAVKGNIFLNLLKTPMGENGKPSTITFNNQESFDTNQEAIYAAVKELISTDLSLPSIKRNGVMESYSTRKLAQELIAYSYATGGIVQGALEFHKFLPIEYLDDMTTLNSKGETRQASEILRMFNSFNSVDGKRKIFAKFVKQYFQNNPDSLEQTTMKKTVLDDGSEIFTPLEPLKKDFLAVKVKGTRSKLKQDKWKVYERVGEEAYYREIDVLGETGVAEYEFETEELKSNLGQSKAPVKNLSELELTTIKDGKLGVIPESGSTVVSFLHAIENGDFGEYENMREIAGFIKDFIRPGEVFVYSGPRKDVKASTKLGSNMYFNLENMQSREDLAITFMHEAMHIATSRFVNLHTDENGNLLESAPSELKSLNFVFEEYKRQLEESDPEGLKEYNDKLKKRAAAKIEKAEKNEREGKDEAFAPTDDLNFTEKELAVYYATTNLKEFIAISLGNNREFKKVASKMNYLESGKSILRKFGEVFSNIIKRIAKQENIPENSIALQAIEKSLGVVKAAYDSERKNPPAAPKIKAISKPEVSKSEMNEFDKFLLGTDGKNDGLNQADNPALDKKDENTQDLLPLMKITKNTCK